MKDRWHIKGNQIACDTPDVGADSQVWIQFGSTIRSTMDRETISDGDKLNDKIINTVQTNPQVAVPNAIGIAVNPFADKKPKQC